MAAAPSAASSAAPLSTTSNDLLLCINCDFRPRYQEGFQVHPYCGKTCAAIHANAVGNLSMSPGAIASQPMAPPLSPTTTTGWYPLPMPPPAIAPASPELCTLPGCGKSVYVDPVTNSPGLYCCKTHMMQGSQIAPLQPLIIPQPQFTGPQQPLFPPQFIPQNGMIIIVSLEKRNILM
ncbi:hypothetical protein FRC17_010321 [Serendipita sp. 399]|nr:hypothetical protein FRC17_010321 [Serendipita sp. 399]